MVRVLLEKGADVNAPGGRYGRALQAASSQGHDHVVQMLLENGADVNAIGERCTNAIQAALKGGHDKVVKLLLNNGASRVQVNVGRSTTKLKQQL